MATMTKAPKNEQYENQMESARVDSKGRIVLPKALREQLGIRPGDTLLMRWSNRLGIFEKATMSPFDVLLEDALMQKREGKTKRIEEVARELGIDLE